MLLAILFWPAAAWAQTGKIAGTVTETGTGEPLPGVNVVIDGTTRGTATNLDGEYVIVGVRPGTYTVVASFIGFQTTRVQDVRVQTDLTTEVDIALQEEVFQGEEVVVTAERPLVQKDLTATTAVVSAEEIQAIPVENFSEVVNLQAGVVDGHFRGGRAGEVGYWVDGIPVTDVYSGELGVAVENNMVEEVQVVTGAFNAEYGQAMSGIVNVVTRDGADFFEGRVSTFWGDYLSTRDDVFMNIEDVSPAAVRNVEGSFSGPVIPDHLFFVVSGRYFHNDGHLYGQNLFSLDEEPRPLIDEDGEIVGAVFPGDSSFVSLNEYDKYSGQAKLTWRALDNLRLQATGIASRENLHEYNHDQRFLPEAQLDRVSESYTGIVKATHTLSNRTFYELGLSNTYSSYEVLPLFEDPLAEGYMDNEVIGIRETQAELLGVAKGWPDSVASWTELVTELRDRGLQRLSLRRLMMDSARASRLAVEYILPGSMAPTEIIDTRDLQTCG